MRVVQRAAVRRAARVVVVADRVAAALLREAAEDDARGGRVSGDGRDRVRLPRDRRLARRELPRPPSRGVAAEDEDLLAVRAGGAAPHAHAVLARPRDVTPSRHRGVERPGEGFGLAGVERGGEARDADAHRAATSAALPGVV
eukprot:31432-Pelagococcus_subviridis.AAC.2